MGTFPFVEAETLGLSTNQGCLKVSTLLCLAAWEKENSFFLCHFQLFFPSMTNYDANNNNQPSQEFIFFPLIIYSFSLSCCLPEMSSSWLSVWTCCNTSPCQEETTFCVLHYYPFIIITKTNDIFSFTCFRCSSTERSLWFKPWPYRKEETRQWNKMTWVHDFGLIADAWL